MVIDAVKATIYKAIDDIRKEEFSGLAEYFRRMGFGLIEGRIEDLLKIKLILKRTNFNEFKIVRFTIVPRSRALVPLSKGVILSFIKKSG